MNTPENIVSLDPTRVYETARSLLPAATRLLKRRGVDPILAEDFLMEVAYHVIDRNRSGKFEIQNLPGYLFTSFKYRALEELRKDQRYENLSEAQFRSLSDQQVALRTMEKEILKEQIMRHLNSEERFILDHRLLGFSFKEISKIFHEDLGTKIAENVLRSKYSKAIQRLSKKFGKSLTAD